VALIRATGLRRRLLSSRPRPADLPQAVWINPPVKQPTVTSDDLQVDQIPDADDHAAILMIDGGATLITSPLVVVPMNPASPDSTIL
jgi:hypothetical protein